MAYSDMEAAAEREISSLHSEIESLRIKLKDAEHHLELKQEELREKQREIGELGGDLRRANELLNNPEIDDFVEAVKLEAANQRKQWGEDRDAKKTLTDWYWTLGYVAGKAFNAARYGDTEKFKLHLISSAALLANCHRHVAPRIKPGEGKAPDWKPNGVVYREKGDGDLSRWLADVEVKPDEFLTIPLEANTVSEAIVEASNAMDVPVESFSFMESDGGEETE